MNQIRAAGVKTGLAINPDTPVDLFFPYLDQVDLCLCMTVNPGFGGQSFKGYVLDKVRELSQKRSSGNHSFLIEVDGGLDLSMWRNALMQEWMYLLQGTSYYKSSSSERSEFALSVGEVDV